MTDPLLPRPEREQTVESLRLELTDFAPSPISLRVRWWTAPLTREAEAE